MKQLLIKIIRFYVKKYMEAGLTYIDFQQGILLSSENPKAIKELNDIIMAWHGFKSRGGNIQQSCYKLGYLHKVTVEGKTIIEVPIETTSNFCHYMIGDVPVFACATSCAGLSNCKLRGGGN